MVDIIMNSANTAARSASHNGGTPQDDSPHDVVVIGFGPVGQTLAILLAQRGHRVAVVERWSGVYPKPRAVTFDDEAARVFASAGIAERFPEFGGPPGEYVWRNAEGKTLLSYSPVGRAMSGWPFGMAFTQPQLEQMLADRASSFPNVTVHRTTEAVDLVQHDDHVTITLQPTPERSLAAADTGRPSGSPGAFVEVLRASYVVGCDGANSFVREHMHTSITELDFRHDWLICDVVENEPRTWSPDVLQVCDPARPTTLVPGGPGRRRWEFMQMPTDDANHFADTDNAWNLLAPWGITPQNSLLEKHAVYTIQARWASEWQDGRLFIAGDAAHVMPPFAGQGMCSGIRDAANLSWKLDLVLRGAADAALLATYASERSAHVQNAIQTSVRLGEILCATDPNEVAARDARLLSTAADPDNALLPGAFARLGPGALQTDTAGNLSEYAGRRAVQGRISTANRGDGLLDEVYGAGFHLLIDASTITRPDLQPHHAAAALIAELEISVIRLVPTANDPTLQDRAVDMDGVLLEHLSQCGHAAQIVRPDGYIFGGVADLENLPALLAELATALFIRRPAPITQ
ncbi:bifunctional 3-(3-hydroxy-phenyl)propionate/3-hydroxycinnamic acid hydroxylase MhpA [Mycolicibacterium sphagni]|uniref:bifunctional 3-(3-hydroxy-phenyl)propionate/3-hydroxycinnamic acid hydroxylase MhpA n=1 Tax=Mycolicibacterium sphagni TaxID=1786 RepID=UPI0021F31259|nr:bifunctional 3-(3-hydroxy-phenyl)propionate/3-hydroxycinnamic acid hydroxylase [Mycolicibacterium sphagni]MCV7174212.1 bifunctional 3-(3-hydroxy-phenyl)propionate/3-hydroxycinnamic acid hydroxylase [Mycolicibacterium sphagni]